RWPMTGWPAFRACGYRGRAWRSMRSSRSTASPTASPTPSSSCTAPRWGWHPARPLDRRARAACGCASRRRCPGYRVRSTGWSRRSVERAPPSCSRSALSSDSPSRLRRRVVLVVVEQLTDTDLDGLERLGTERIAGGSPLHDDVTGIGPAVDQQDSFFGVQDPVVRNLGCV